jgi:hypothetical protein
VTRLALCLIVPLCWLGIAAPAAAAFDLQPGGEGFEALAEEGGLPFTSAGGHPYALRLHLAFRTEEGPGGNPLPQGDLRDLSLRLPPGMLANPAVVPRCSVADFHTARVSPFEASASGESCPAATQVGTVEVKSAGPDRRFGLFNLAPPPGVAAELGFAPFGEPVALAVRFLPGGDGRYSLQLQVDNFPQAAAIYGLDLSLWGTPWGASHDGERGNCLNEAEPEFPWGKCSVGSPAAQPPQAYLTMSTDCSEPLTFGVRATSWGGTGAAAAYTENDGGEPVLLKGCPLLRFEPGAFGQLTSNRTSSPSGFVFSLVGKTGGLTEPSGRTFSQVRQALVSLPEGVTINPSLGSGLGVCTPAQLAAESPGSPPGTGCPEGAKIGDFNLSTPLVGEKLEGAIYLAEPDDSATPAPGAENPFDSLLAVYLVARSGQSGFLVEVPGELIPDPATGTLEAHFDDLPQFPYSNLEINFRTGQRAPLVTPAGCGVARTGIEMVPWAGALQTSHSETTSKIDAGIGGRPCPSGTPPFAPNLVAGSTNSNVGSYSPFYVHITRGDDEQELTSYSLVLPKGITGRIAGIPFCPDPAIAAARTSSGAAEVTAPSCPQASRIGSIVSGYGVGLALAYATGGLYLAGPYQGSPLSVVAVNPAVVGPFDLGTVVIRFAFKVDPETAQLSIDASSSDRIPHILRGVPLHLRDIRVFADRPGFTRNPSSCEASRVTSALTGSGARFGDPADDSTAVGSNFFQLLNCRSLGFRPKLGIRLRGPARRGGYPSLRATFASRGDADSNLKAMAVTMPHTMFLAQNHIAGICTRQQFSEEQCPANSAYGKAVAYTPLFDEPLRGNVYLRSSSHRLPDLVASLRSGAVRIVLAGKIGPAKGGIRVQFENLPDAPLQRFVLTMAGGRHGLLQNSANICAVQPLASVKALGQNNLGALFTTRLRGQCQEKGGRDKHKPGGKGR